LRARRAIAALLVAALAALVLAPAAGAGAAGTKKDPKIVKVRDDFFTPTKVKVKKGGFVKWSWGDQNINSHNVTLKHGPKGVKRKKFRSITGAIGISFKKQFTVKGKYNFYCTIHPDIMRMQVVVKKK
jgi:plastocyanin